MPARVQRRRKKGWRMPDNCVYVGRGTIWGNPFKGEDAAEKYREAFRRKHNILYLRLQSSTICSIINIGGASAYKI